MSHAMMLATLDMGRTPMVVLGLYMVMLLGLGGSAKCEAMSRRAT